MEKVLDFLANNYELIILVAACLLDLILFLCGVFKKKTVDPSVNTVISYLPFFICSAEKKFGNGNGNAKKDFVMDCACKLYERMTDVQVQLRSSIYRSFELAIEEILKTPQKKG